MNDHAKLREQGFVGFAHLYLSTYDYESKSDDQIDIQVYTKLVKLDTKLGTTATEQLYWCVHHALSLNLIRV